jgi:hypothetical protein
MSLLIHGKFWLVRFSYFILKHRPAFVNNWISGGHGSKNGERQIKLARTSGSQREAIPEPEGILISVENGENRRLPPFYNSRRQA